MKVLALALGQRPELYRGSHWSLWVEPPQYDAKATRPGFPDGGSGAYARMEIVDDTLRLLRGFSCHAEPTAGEVGPARCPDFMTEFNKQSQPPRR